MKGFEDSDLPREVIETIERKSRVKGPTSNTVYCELCGSKVLVRGLNKIDPAGCFVCKKCAKHT
jgi:formylmethanofuran dehydrogenase subunit E